MLWKTKTEKPRVPGAEDWSKRYRPSLDDFVGNASALEILRAHESGHVLICGPKGSGKTALAYAVGSKFGDVDAAFDGSEAQVKTLGLQKNKVVLLDGFGDLSGRAQQTAYTATLGNERNNIIFIFTATKRDDVIDKVAAKCQSIVELKKMPTKLVLETLLRIAKDERVGYDRRGIQLLFDLQDTAKTRDLGRAIRGLHRVFLRYHFVSYENVCRELAPDRWAKATVLEIDAKAALGDLTKLPRCPRCTLIPPCRHITEATLAEWGHARRAELPRRTNALACDCFLKTGACRVFNDLGRCSLHHPPNAHRIKPPPRRCPVCTLPWPCQKCSPSSPLLSSSKKPPRRRKTARRK